MRWNHDSGFLQALMTCLLTMVAAIVEASRTVQPPNCARYFGSESFACVCNTDHCDYIGQTIHPTDNSFLIYTSDIYRDRLKVTIYSSDDVRRQLKPTKKANVIVKVDQGARKQKIFGFGGAFTDSAGINIRSLPPLLSRRLIEEYFCKDGGIGYSFGRIVVGVSDFSARDYSYDDVENDFELKKFSLVKEDLEFKIPLIKQAMQCNPKLRLFTGSWFPPAWTLTTKNYVHAGKLIGPVGGKYYQLWADYHVKFLDAYKGNGINFWGIATPNEPSYAAEGNISTPFSATELRDFFKLNLIPALKKGGYESLMKLIFDETLVNFTVYVDTLMKDPESAKEVSGIATHWYYNDEVGYSAFDYGAEQYPDKFILATEACAVLDAGIPVMLGNWTRAERYVYDILESLNRNVVGWIDWNIALDLNGGPNRINNFVDSPIIVDPVRKEYYRQPMFYAMAHFSKFIEPDSQRLGVESKQQDPKVKLMAALDKLNRVIMVILNQNSEAKVINISGFCSSSIQLTLPARSIQTLISESCP